MPYSGAVGRADFFARAGRPLLWVAGFVLLAAIAAVIAFSARDREVITPVAPAKSTESLPATRADGAAQLLLDLTDALTQGDRRGRDQTGRSR